MDNFHRRDLHLGVLIYRHAAAIVDDCHGVVLVDDDLYFLAESGQRLIHTVVHDLVDQVMKASGASGSYVHTRSLSDSLKAFQYLDLISSIFASLFLI